MYHYRVEGLCHGAAARMRTREVGSHSDILTCAEVENARAAARVAVEILDANILREMGKVRREEVNSHIHAFIIELNSKLIVQLFNFYFREFFIFTTTHNSRFQTLNSKLKSSCASPVYLYIIFVMRRE